MFTLAFLLCTYSTATFIADCNNLNESKKLSINCRIDFLSQQNPPSPLPNLPLSRRYKQDKQHFIIKTQSKYRQLYTVEDYATMLLIKKLWVIWKRVSSEWNVWLDMRDMSLIHMSSAVQSVLEGVGQGLRYGCLPSYLPPVSYTSSTDRGAALAQSARPPLLLGKEAACPADCKRWLGQSSLIKDHGLCSDPSLLLDVHDGVLHPDARPAGELQRVPGRAHQWTQVDEDQSLRNWPTLTHKSIKKDEIYTFCVYSQSV